MAIIDKKRKIFAKLSAINALANVKKDKLNNSIGSINNKINSIEFLADFTIVLVGAKVIKDYVVDCISNRLPEFELAIKDNLKRQFKERVSCGVDASIPAWFQHGGPGIELAVPNIDFYDLMRTDPTSFPGSLIYTDVPSNLNSKDFNTYLYYTIQDKTPKLWGNSVSGVDILESTFFESTTATVGNPSKNNIIKYTTSPTYSNKKLTDFNNDFIDTLSLFGNPSSLDSPKVITLIMEELFGSLSSSIGKSKKKIKKELEVKEVLKCIIDSQDGNITDNFFNFDNPTLAKIDRETNNRQNGIRELKTCDNLLVQVALRDISTQINPILSATTKANEIKAVTDALDGLANLQASFSSNAINIPTIKLNFIMEIVKNLQMVIMSAIITPEFMSLFAINHQIIYGKGSTYDGAFDFIAKNVELMKDVGLIVLKMLLNLLLTLVGLYITVRLKEMYADNEIEKAVSYVNKLLSYAGVPPEIMTQLNKIGSGNPLSGVIAPISGFNSKS